MLCLSAQQLQLKEPFSKLILLMKHEMGGYLGIWGCYGVCIFAEYFFGYFFNLTTDHHLWAEISVNMNYDWWFPNPIVFSELPPRINLDRDSAGMSIDKRLPPSGGNIQDSWGVKLWSNFGQDGPLSVCGSLCVWSRWLIAAAVCRVAPLQQSCW